MFLLHGLEAPGSPDSSTTAIICGFGHPSLKLVNFSGPTFPGQLTNSARVRNRGSFQLGVEA